MRLVYSDSLVTILTELNLEFIFTFLVFKLLAVLSLNLIVLVVFV